MVTPWRLGVCWLTACKSLSIFSSMCPSTLLVIGVALTLLSAQCTELNSLANTLPTICAGDARARAKQPSPQPAAATESTRTPHECHERGMGAMLDRTGFSFFRLTSLRGGSDDSRTGKRPGSFRKEYTRQPPAGRSTRETQNRLHQDLQRCQTLHYWCDFINTNAGQLDAANTAFAFKVIVRLKVFGWNKQLRQPFSKISAHASAIVGEMTANQIGDIFWVHGKMRLRMQEPLWEALGRQAVASAENFSSKNVANTVWSLAKERRQCKMQRELVDVLSKWAVRTAADFNPQDVANLMWALATMGLQTVAGLVSAMSKQAARAAD
eukprot:1585282-Rhodomonas_salina.1